MSGNDSWTRRFVRGRQLANAAARRAGPIAAQAEADDVISLSTTSSFLNTVRSQAVDDVNSFIDGLSLPANSIVLDDVEEPSWSHVEQIRAARAVRLASVAPGERLHRPAVGAGVVVPVSLCVVSLSLIWEARSTPVACVVCGVQGPGQVIAVVPGTDVGDLEVARCGACGSVDLVGAVVSFADTDDVIDAYVEVGAGLGSMLAVLATVDPTKVRRFLDVGCGYGFTLDMVERLWGWEAVGVEIERSGRRGAAELGVTIVDHLDALAAPGSSSADTAAGGFDLVLSSEVVEHVADPVPFLTRIRELLGPGGLLLLTTPAAEVVDRSEAVPEVLAALSPGYHAFLASVDGLTTLLGRAGFDTVRVERRGPTLFAAAGDLGPLADGGPTLRLFPDEAAATALARRYLDDRRVPGADPSALASGLTTRRLRALVAAGSWDEVPAALAEATGVLARRHGVWLDDLAALRRQVLASADLPPLTLAPIAFAAGMWALVDERPADARDLFDLCVAAVRRLDDAGFSSLEFVDLAEQGEFHAALAAARIDPDSACRRALDLNDADGRSRCRVFTEVVTSGGAERGAGVAFAHLADVVATAAPVLATDDDPTAVKVGVDGLYALGIASLASEDPLGALGWFQRCRDAALHAPADSNCAHLVDVAAEHVHLSRQRVVSAARPGDDSPPVGPSPLEGDEAGGSGEGPSPVVTHHLQSYWCDAAGTYVDGWVSSPDGDAEVLGVRTGGVVHSASDSLPPLLDSGDPRRVPFAVHTAGSPHGPASLVVRVTSPSGAREIELPLQLPVGGLPPRSPASTPAVVPDVGSVTAGWLAEAPDGPVLAVGMREAVGSSEPAVGRLFGDRDVVSVDIHPGPGVTLVADVHDLASVVEPESFAIVYSSSVLEHLRLPWVAAAQMSRALAVGGLAVQVAPWVFPTHSEPTDFWRMSAEALAVLFGPEMGFEVLEVGDSYPVAVVPDPSWRTPHPLELRMPTLSSASMSWIVARKVAPTPEIVWPIDHEVSRRVATTYPLDGVVPPGPSCDDPRSGTE